MRIQHNIMAMSAYRNYTNNVSAMKKNLEKLSSGYKINRAGDDAAGLAISEKMRAQITGLETAQKNAKDGISLVQTAEGALTEVHDMLNRMVELATQSANGTYDDTTDRAQMQKELNQLRSEIDRIADSSNFNGIKLLNGEMSGTGALGDFTGIDVSPTNDGSQSSLKTQKGEYTLDLGQTVINATDAGATVNLTIGNESVMKGGNAAALGNTAAGEIALKTTLTAGDFTSSITIDGNTFAVTFADGVVTLKGEADPTAAFTASMTAALAIVSGASNHGEDLAVHVNEVRQYADKPVLAQGNFTLTTDMVKNGNQITIGDTTYTFQVGKGNTASGPNVIDLTAFTDGDLLKEAANALSRLSSGNDKFDITADGQTGKVYLTEKEGKVDYEADWDLKGKANTAGQTSDATWKNTTTNESAVRWAAVGAATGKSLTLQIGDTADSFNQLKVDIGDMHCSSLGIDSTNLSIADQASAQAALDKIKAAINKVSDVRGTLGATQNRLDHTINNLSVMTENIQDAESTIRDVDVAEEMMAYTKNNILIQSAQAMLAQANQVPQGVLQLLQ